MVEIGFFTSGMIILLAGSGITVIAVFMTIIQILTNKKRREKIEQQMKEKY